jgi:hypothetical protein
MMKVRFLLSPGRPVTLALEAGSTVATAKAALRKEIANPDAKFTFVHAGNVVEDETRLDSLSFTNGSYIFARVELQRGWKELARTITPEKREEYRLQLTANPDLFEAIATEIFHGEKVEMPSPDELMGFLGIERRGLGSTKPTDEEIMEMKHPKFFRSRAGGTDAFIAWPENAITDGRLEPAGATPNDKTLNLLPVPAPEPPHELTLEDKAAVKRLAARSPQITEELAEFFYRKAGRDEDKAAEMIPNAFRRSDPDPPDFL